jgi:anti-sigma factor RsiW
VDQETRQLLAWYVNGTLAGADRDRVEAALQQDPAASELLAWERAVQEATKSDPLFDIAPDRGLHQAMQRIRADAKAQPAAPRKVQAGWFAGFRERFRWSPALAFACTLVAVQFVVIAQMWSAKDEEGEFAAVRAMEARKQAAADAFIHVAFKPESTEGEVSTLLRTLHAEIVAGPSQLGDYYLLLDKLAVQDALYALQNNANIESAEIVNALPARP